MEELNVYLPSELAEIVKDYQEEYETGLQKFQNNLFVLAKKNEETLQHNPYIIKYIPYGKEIVYPFYNNLGYYVSRGGDVTYMISLYPDRHEAYTTYPNSPRIKQFIRMAVKHITHHANPSRSAKVKISYINDLNIRVPGWEHVITDIVKVLDKRSFKCELVDRFIFKISIQHDYSHKWLNDYAFFKKRKLE